MSLRGLPVHKAPSPTVDYTWNLSISGLSAMIYRADEAFFIAGWLISSLWGVLTILVFYCIFKVYQRRANGPISQSLYVTAAAVVFLYILATSYTVLSFLDLLNALVFTSNAEERNLYLATNGSAISVTNTAFIVFILVICDIILFWRLHVMWPRKWLTLSSILLLLAESAAGIAAIVVYSPAFLKNDLEHFTLMLKIFMITSLATNLFVPVLTAARIWWFSRSIPKQAASRYRLITHLILDSGIIITIAKIFEITFFFMGADIKLDIPGETNESFRIVNQILPLISAMVPTIIIIAVNSADAITVAERATQHITPIVFATFCSARRTELNL